MSSVIKISKDRADKVSFRLALPSPKVLAQGHNMWLGGSARFSDVLPKDSPLPSECITISLEHLAPESRTNSRKSDQVLITISAARPLSRSHIKALALAVIELALICGSPPARIQETSISCTAVQGENSSINSWEQAALPGLGEASVWHGYEGAPAISSQFHELLQPWFGFRRQFPSARRLIGDTVFSGHMSAEGRALILLRAIEVMFNVTHGVSAPDRKGATLRRKLSVMAQRAQHFSVNQSDVGVVPRVADLAEGPAIDRILDLHDELVSSSGSMRLKRGKLEMISLHLCEILRHCAFGELFVLQTQRSSEEI